MNILLINYEFPPLGAGASTATWHIGKELAAMDHEITILTSGFNKNIGYDSKEGMTIFRCPAIRKKASESNILEMLSFVVSAFFFMPWIIIKHHIKGVIVFFSFPCGPLGLWANMLFKVPYIISLRGGDVPGTEKRLDRMHKILQPFRRLIFKRSRAVIANSKGLKELAIKADPVNISIIPNGIDTSFFVPAKSKKKNQCFELLFVGRLSEQKNLMFLIKQISEFKKAQKIKIKLHIAGDGPLKTKIQHYAKNLGISDIIIWHGWVDKTAILALCQKADCFINPSLYEGMPNAVLEAMACGLPVIASNVAGNNAVVIDGHNGFLFDLGDQGKIKDSLNMIIKNPHIASRLGQNARKRLIEKFSWGKTAGEYVSVLQTCC